MAGATLWFAGYEATGLALQTVGSALRVREGGGLLAATALGCTAYGVWANNSYMIGAGMLLAVADALRPAPQQGPSFSERLLA